MRRVRLRDSHLEERFGAERGGLCGGRPTYGEHSMAQTARDSRRSMVLMFTVIIFGEARPSFAQTVGSV